MLTISTLVFGVNSLVLKPSTAVELLDGQKAFESSFRLIRTATNFSERNNSAARYQFTIEVPQDAGEALKSVKITQKENMDTLVFKADKTLASMGNNLAGANIPLAAVGGESKPGETTIVFDTPIEPGNTVTISVKPKQNPFTGGVYLFGVTAYPTGEDSPGLYLGSGRIHIYD
ncbi:DUF2808 domain-containing protein [Hyella patelloides]|uniref:DUF2808 domain-containing protein n=1 Tax=Hyella patelloides TaxID=1982969 RepID=UPI001FECE8E7|nr:DUF2808 domain-containing protein [Hyella patelloides]